MYPVPFRMGSDGGLSVEHMAMPPERRLDSWKEIASYFIS
jgi:hypothetical protein